MPSAKNQQKTEYFSNIPVVDRLNDLTDTIVLFLLRSERIAGKDVFNR